MAGAIDLTLRAAPGTVELGRRRAHTRLLNGGCPDQVRVRRGGRVRIYPEPDPLPVGVGEYVRFVIGEATGMLHPMHLYGHFFRTGGRAARSRRRSFRRRCGSRRSTGSATAPAGWACH